MRNSAGSVMVVGVLCAALWASRVTAGEAPDAAEVASGKALVEANCGRCHAIGLADKSPHPEAPAFRTLSERYPIDALQETLAEGIFTGHPDMPEFQATPEQIGEIIAYIKTLQP